VVGGLAVRDSLPPLLPPSPRPQLSNSSLSEYTFTVLLLVRFPGLSSSATLCGATLLSPTLALTAAHCLAPAASLPSAASVTAFLGWPDAGALLRGAAAGPAPPGAQALNATAWEWHPGWAAAWAPSARAHDLALVWLAAPAAAAAAAALDWGEAQTGAGSTLLALGWGLTDPGNPLSYAPALRAGNASAAAAALCAAQQGAEANGSNAFDDSRQLCATAVACEGDSGGPLLAAAAGEARQVGVTSWGAAARCGQGYGGFTRVSCYLPWLRRRLPALQQPPPRLDEASFQALLPPPLIDQGILLTAARADAAPSSLPALAPVGQLCAAAAAAQAPLAAAAAGGWRTGAGCVPAGVTLRATLLVTNAPYAAWANGSAWPPPAAALRAALARDLSAFLAPLGLGGANASVGCVSPAAEPASDNATRVSAPLDAAARAAAAAAAAPGDGPLLLPLRIALASSEAAAALLPALARLCVAGGGGGGGLDLSGSARAAQAALRLPAPPGLCWSPLAPQPSLSAALLLTAALPPDLPAAAAAAAAAALGAAAPRLAAAFARTANASLALAPPRLLPPLFSAPPAPHAPPGAPGAPAGPAARLAPPRRALGLALGLGLGLGCGCLLALRCALGGLRARAGGKAAAAAAERVRPPPPSREVRRG